MSKHCKFYDICPARKEESEICNDKDEKGNCGCIPLLIETYYSLSYIHGNIGHGELKRLLNKIYGTDYVRKPEKIVSIVYNGKNLDEVLDFCKSVWPKATVPLKGKRAVIRPDEDDIDKWQIYITVGSTLVKVGNDIVVLDNDRR